MKHNSIPELIEDFRAGRMIVLIDDEDRENEGDLVMAASKVTPEDINFMTHHGRGLICMPITRERCEQLNLLLMVNKNEARFATNFTISIEAAEGITTGISAYDRAHTIRTAARADAGPANIAQPGHVFPLMAQPGGVLTRAGHTEAGVDLALLSGLEPAAVLVEILNEDGTMARRPELEVYAEKHGLKIGTIADLIRYRLETEHSVECLSSTEVETDFGRFRLLTYRDGINNQIHLALLKGEVDPAEPMLIRVHVKNPLSDVLGIKRDDFGLPLRMAMEEIAREGAGMVLVLGGHEDDEDLLRRIQSQPEASVLRGGDSRESSELRTYGIGAQIIVDMGIRKMRVLSSPKRMTGLAGFGLEVVEYVESAPSTTSDEE
jgi:3,4-dihydroxy 2-butanone 4-phosphate synthase/GTP cyclohydrolase II